MNEKTNIVTNLLENNELPTLPLEFEDASLYKLSAMLVFSGVVIILIAYLFFKRN